jgi:hypothetical protein
VALPLDQLCFHSTIFPQGHRQKFGGYPTVGKDFIFLIDVSPCPVLSAIVPQLFPLHDHQICGRQNVASALETDDNRSATNSLSINAF